MNKKTLSLLSIATSGMILAASASAATGTTTVAKAGGKVKCEHSSACKAHGACKTEANSCKGQNACKGQGWTMQKNEAACAKAQAKNAAAPAAEAAPEAK